MVAMRVTFMGRESSDVGLVNLAWMLFIRVPVRNERFVASRTVASRNWGTGRTKDVSSRSCSFEESVGSMHLAIYQIGELM